jgi:hypothetical protein
VVKLKDALLFIAAIEDAEDELKELAVGEEMELPVKLYVRVAGRRVKLRLIAEVEK